MIFSCSSGHVLTAKAELAGQKVRCPICQEIVEAPPAGGAPLPMAILVGPPPVSGPAPPIALPAPLPQSCKAPALPVLEITEILPEEPPKPTAFREGASAAVSPPLTQSHPEPAPYS